MRRTLCIAYIRMHHLNWTMQEPGKGLTEPMLWKGVRQASRWHFIKTLDKCEIPFNAAKYLAIACTRIYAWFCTMNYTWVVYHCHVRVVASSVTNTNDIILQKQEQWTMSHQLTLIRFSIKKIQKAIGSLYY